jgi:gamma-glutamylcysteine synthetase
LPFIYITRCWSISKDYFSLKRNWARHAWKKRQLHGVVPLCTGLMYLKNAKSKGHNFLKNNWTGLLLYYAHLHSVI